MFSAVMGAVDLAVDQGGDIGTPLSSPSLSPTSPGSPGSPLSPMMSSGAGDDDLLGDLTLIKDEALNSSAAIAESAGAKKSKWGLARGAMGFGEDMPDAK